MVDAAREQGTISAIIARFNSHRLPRVLEVKARVLKGERLGEFDLRYLERVVRDIRHLQHLSQNNPRYQALFAQVISLYAEVTAAALENERLNNRP
ncbi:MAG: hypothetical protein V7752_18890 [Halopseudomonas sp.]